MINREKLIPYVEGALQNDEESVAIVREVLRPLATDSVDEIYEKISIFIRLVFLKSLSYKDAPFHIEIDKAYAKQVHSLLTTGKPFYQGIIIVGYKESAKTSRVKFNECYISLYLPDVIDYTHVVSESIKSAEQFNMDLFNILAFSSVNTFFPNTIEVSQRPKKKESQTMNKFTTSQGVTYSATAARITTRGGVQVDVTDDGDVETKRPKKVIFDDIETEVTVRSYTTTQQIGDVMNATIDSLDQVSGFWVLIGNYFSLRGNIHRIIQKHRDDDRVFKLLIPIVDTSGAPTWEGKYVRTDKEERELSEKGIVRASVETIQRNSENFQTEFLNNPKRSLVYFGDDVVAGLKEEGLVGEENRDETGLLTIKEPEKTGVYIIPVDSAKGTGGDQSAFVVIRKDGIRYEEVANFKSNTIKPENFAPYTANIARLYNTALVIPENNYPGNEFIAFLLPLYNHIYIARTDINKQGEKVYEYGVHTNLKTKPDYFLTAKRLLKDLLITVHSKILYNQILEYPADDIHSVVQKDGSGGHFDILMAFVIGLWKAPTIGQEVSGDQRVDDRIRDIARSIYATDTNNR